MAKQLIGWQYRVLREHIDMKYKLSQLVRFMGTAEFQNLEVESQKLLVQQMDAMSFYVDVLKARIDLFQKEG